MTLGVLTPVLLAALGLAGQAAAQCPSPCRCLKFEGLRSVYCNGTGITSVPKGIPTNTQVLELSDNGIGSIPEDAFSGLVNLQQLYLSGIGLNDESIADKALNLPMLQSIDLAENFFTAVPNNLPRNVTYIDLYGNKITYLVKDSFVNYTSLTAFDMQQNGLTGIDVGTFDVLQDINWMDLSFNKLTDDSFPYKLFSKNLKLQYVRLRFNQLRHMVKDMPPSMLHLDYVGNHITTLPAYALRSMPNLQTIEFWEGQVGLPFIYHRGPSYERSID